MNEIRDRSVLRLYESADVAGGSLPAGLSAQSHMWADQDQSYFSEPEFDSEFQHQHIHKTKVLSYIPFSSAGTHLHLLRSVGFCLKMCALFYRISTLVV